MLTTISTFLATAALISASPIVQQRTVTALNADAFAEAQVRDNTATRAFSSVEIQTSAGQCVFIDELSGDFRANLTPLQVGACSGSTGQLWDIITAGKHNNAANSMLIVNTLTQSCCNFDPRRAAGNTVIGFSCGGRADGGGSVTNSQLFSFNGTAGPLAFQPENAPGTCFTVKGAVIDEAPCDPTDQNQSFTFGAGGAGNSSVPVSSLATPPSPTSSDLVATSVSSLEVAAADSTTAACSAVTVTVTASAPSIPSITDLPTAAATTEASTIPAAATTPAPVLSSAVASEIPATGTGVISVSRAGGILNPSAVAESNPRDNTATRAFTGAQIKASNGQCLFIDSTAGDFRENLIPIALQACTGSANEQFDFITAGVHNNLADSALIVSSLTQGCINFDPRRAANDTVIMFSCGGRADGGGAVTNSQLFPFTAGTTSLTLAPENGNNATCLIISGSRIGSGTCDGSADQLFTIG